MPDSDNQTAKLSEPPPSGDHKQAEPYLSQIIQFVDQDLLHIHHTDLSKFDPTALQDHYRLELKEYEVEVSHSKHPDTGKDSYILLFNNIKKVAQNDCQKVILAYMHLAEEQFQRFRKAKENQTERRRKEEEEKRLKEALQPIDEALEELTDTPSRSKETNGHLSELKHPPAQA